MGNRNQHHLNLTAELKTSYNQMLEIYTDSKRPKPRPKSLTRSIDILITRLEAAKVSIANGETSGAYDEVLGSKT